MIDTPDTERPAGAGRPAEAALPVSARAGRFLILLTVFLCAACALVYELELIALADYLDRQPAGAGGPAGAVTGTSVVLSLMVFAMGLGSLAAGRLRGRPSAGFAVVEALLALTGGTSAMALYGCFLLFGETRPLLVGLALATGVLIGAEMPLLMTLIQRVRAQDPGRAVADLTAADYVGALLGGLAFPFLLLPSFGQLTAALVTGLVNAVAGGTLVLWLFRRDLGRRRLRRLGLLAGGVVAVLLACLAAGPPLERATAERVAGRPDGGAAADVRSPAGRGISDPIMPGG
jgi:spermidine synthase